MNTQKLYAVVDPDGALLVDTVSNFPEGVWHSLYRIEAESFGIGIPYSSPSDCDVEDFSFQKMKEGYQVKQVELKIID